MNYLNEAVAAIKGLSDIGEFVSQLHGVKVVGRDGPRALPAKVRAMEQSAAGLGKICATAHSIWN